MNAATIIPIKLVIDIFFSSNNVVINMYTYMCVIYILIDLLIKYISVCLILLK